MWSTADAIHAVSGDWPSDADHASECNDAWIEDYALIGD
jgi:hypothetical protein